jgi:HEAT repeat protein
MARLIWTLDKLVRFSRSEDPEVRYWAVDRLIRHHASACCDRIAGLLFDDHDLTPSAVARHLGEHGNQRHHAVLVRGFRTLRGQTPGFCLQALTRLGYAGAVDLAGSALKREDLTEPALGTIIEALGELGTPEARDRVRDFVARKVDVLVEPAAMRGALRLAQTSEIPDVLSRFLAALRLRGSHRAGEAFRTVMDVLQIDDTSWCFRTGPSGHIELRKTIKAVESGYDCDISTAMGTATINQIAQRFRAGNVGEIVRAIAEWTCVAVADFPHEPGSDLPARIAAAVGAFTRQELLDDVERLGHQFQQWLLGFQLSAAFAVARGVNFELSLKRARGNLDELLALAEYETAFLLNELPAAIAVVCREDDARPRKAQEWCLRMLEAKGPFFPKVVALETLGELGGVHFIPEMMEYLADENSYVYGAAERALSRLGETIIQPAVERIDSGSLNPDAAHSLLVLLCDMGTLAAYDAVSQHLDWFMDIVGPGTTAEWVSLFGTEDLIDPLRDWLEVDTAAVGQGLLLLGAIHNIAIPEEDEILEAIEDARARQQSQESGEDDGTLGGPDGPGGSYVM